MPLDFWRLWQGQLVSHLGTQAFNVMALFWMAEHTGAAGAGAAFLALSMLAPALLGPMLVRWAQRWSPRRVLVTGDLVAAAVTAPVLLGCFVGGSESVILLLLLASAALLGLVNALTMPSLHAVVPALVPADRLPSANGWMVVTPQLASVAGQGLGGLVYALLGPALLCLGNVVSFLSSAALASRIESSVLRQPPPKAATSKTSWALLKQSPSIRELTWISAVFNALYAPWLVLLPFQLKEVAGAQAAGFGFALSTYAVGNVVGAALARKFLNAVGPKVLTYSLLGQAAALFLLGAAGTMWQLLAALACMGTGMGLANVLTITRAQQLSQPEERGMTFAVIRSTVYLATPVGYGIVAIAQQGLQVSPAHIYFACGLLLAAVLVPRLLALRRQARLG